MSKRNVKSHKQTNNSPKKAPQTHQFQFKNSNRLTPTPWQTTVNGFRKREQMNATQKKKRLWQVKSMRTCGKKEAIKTNQFSCRFHRLSKKKIWVHQTSKYHKELLQKDRLRRGSQPCQLQQVSFEILISFRCQGEPVFDDAYAEKVIKTFQGISNMIIFHFSSARRIFPARRKVCSSFLIYFEFIFRYKRFEKSNGLDRTAFSWIMKGRIPKECAEMVYDLFDTDHNGTLDIFEFSKMLGSMIFTFSRLSFLSSNSSLRWFIRAENESSVQCF